MPNIEDRVESGDASSAPSLRASGIEKTYQSKIPFAGGSVEVLTGADIELYPGEIVGIVGANGSGKSTLMKILVGALQPDGGSVSRDATVGWCPQETLLYDRLTVRETFDLFGEAYDMADARVESRRDELATQLDFEQYLDYRVDHLSGGNRQKVNLAIALLHDPDVLLLDEPTSDLDPRNTAAIEGAIAEAVDRGIGVVVATHDMHQAERVADRVAVLLDGRVTEVGPTDRVFDDPRDPRTRRFIDGELVY